MVPEREWRGAGQNMDKRTARKVHSADFKRTLHTLREQYLRDHAQRQQQQQRAQQQESDAHDLSRGNDHIHVYVRKRPVLPHELAKNEFDVISSIGSREIVIHECKMHNDMRHKYIVSHHQRFSDCYDERVDTDVVYDKAAKHLVLHAMGGGKAVCMMYGQTGSGKTHTMGGFFQYIAEDVFTEAVGDVDFSVSVAAIEIAGAKCFDLIADRSKVVVCEDGDGHIQLLGSSELEADSTNALLDVLENVKSLRTTESTDVNSQSSRSHLVCYINLRYPVTAAQRAQNQRGKLYGQLALLDLAGSERNADSFHHDAARRKETIEINKSHLALKECLRAIGSEDTSGYVPYRASTLTRILKDCLWSKDAKASVIATISPLSIDTEHTLHALLCAGQMLEDAPHISTDWTEVPEEDEGETVVPIREWDNDRVKHWVASLRKREFEKYVSNISGAVDGRMLVRFSVARFKQICNGSAADASHLYKALRDEMAQQEKVLKAKREHTAARNK